ncbi:Hypothetical protein Minf_0306 [Methylacidiphilum infernorum V4]|uniref:Uncharacterized protein n=1 Tax=Methylacidiphilum infernorum (isolate V4) TaxID=481448 RepID=B3DY89_METI4|nr:Hypothetical protein Minf_0306 [Methylacidiphilum infernorum V4]
MWGKVSHRKEEISSLSRSIRESNPKRKILPQAKCFSFIWAVKSVYFPRDVKKINSPGKR